MLSIVVPIYNEHEVVEPFYHRLSKTLAGMLVPWEVVFVDDGSTDGTAEKLAALASIDARLRVVELTRNFGHQAALSRGLEYVGGDWVVTMHSDLEDRPEDIPALYAKAQEGHDVVCAVRDSRQKSWLKDMGTRLYYLVMAGIADYPAPEQVGDYSVMSREVVETLKSMPERNRNLSGLRSWVGYRQAGLPLPRDPRPFGEPKQSYRRLFLHAADAIFSFSTAPLQLMIPLGAIASLLGLLASIGVLLWRLFHSDVPLGWASLMLVMIFLGGVQLMGMGVLGQYLARIYDEVRGRPGTLVRKVIGGSRQ
jgi:glycosyltransferase involved in cell wall biosynthesis